MCSVSTLHHSDSYRVGSSRKRAISQSHAVRIHCGVDNLGCDGPSVVPFFAVVCKLSIHVVTSCEPCFRGCLPRERVPSPSPVRPRVSFPPPSPSLRKHLAPRRERDRWKSTCSLMERVGASSESQDAPCPPPPPPPPHPRPTTSSHQSSAPVASSVVSPSTQARQAFKFAAPAAAVRGAAPPVLATKRPTSLPTTGTSFVAAPPVAGTALTTSRLRQFQSSSATDPSRALSRAWAPAPARGTTTAPVVAGDLDVDDADDVDEVLLAGQTLELVKHFDAAQRQVAAPLSTEKEAKTGRPLQEEAVATDSREKIPTKGDLDPFRRDRNSHKSQTQASSRGPRSFQPTRPSHLRGETRSSSSAAVGTSEDSSNATTENRKRTSPQETADAPVQKRQREGAGEKGDDSTKKSSREVTPRTDPPVSEVEGQKTHKKSTSARPSTTDRFKRSSASRSSESRSRPATTAAFFDETMANLRRWQRHEGELVRRDLLTQLSGYPRGSADAAVRFGRRTKKSAASRRSSTSRTRSWSVLAPNSTSSSRI